MDKETELLVEVAHLYYELNLSQKKIAEKVGVSNATLSRLIQKAKDTGIVQISIISPTDRDGTNDRLVTELKTKFGLKHVVVIPSSPNIGYLFQVLGHSCAQLLQELITHSMVMGFSGGRSVSSVVNYLKKANYSLELVPLMGAVNSMHSAIHADMITWNAAKAMGGISHILHSPAIISDISSAEHLKSNPVVGHVFQLFEKIDVALVGIGTMQRDTPLMQANLLSEAEIAYLKQEGSVGEICGRFFDRDGKELDNDIARRSLSITLKQLKNIDNVCAVATGLEKVEPVFIGAKAGFFNSLVTDSVTAKALIEAN